MFNTLGSSNLAEKKLMEVVPMNEEKAAIVREKRARESLERRARSRSDHHGREKNSVAALAVLPRIPKKSATSTAADDREKPHVPREPRRKDTRSKKESAERESVLKERERSQRKEEPRQRIKEEKQDRTELEDRDSLLVWDRELQQEALLMEERRRQERRSAQLAEEQWRREEETRRQQTERQAEERRQEELVRQQETARDQAERQLTAQRASSSVSGSMQYPRYYHCRRHVVSGQPLPPVLQAGLAKPILRGITFGGLSLVPKDLALDPPTHGCFNCWSIGHKSLNCHEYRVLHCSNCGRLHVSVSDCPRCAAAYVRYLEGYETTLKAVRLPPVPTYFIRPPEFPVSAPCRLPPKDATSGARTLYRPTPRDKAVAIAYQPEEKPYMPPSDEQVQAWDRMQLVRHILLEAAPELPNEVKGRLACGSLAHLRQLISFVKIFPEVSGAQRSGAAEQLYLDWSST